MAGVETLEIFREIQALVSDKLQVVSYKWLSRNFSVSSNHAKRLLKEFVDKRGNELEVVYTLSGWLRNNPQMYCIKLASRLNFAGVRQEFAENCSIQVYSVQACLPKDLSLLWSAEFVQAEELFNQPSTTENCLRDNRFCGVSNSYVKRLVDGKSASAGVQLNNETGTAERPKTSSILKDPYVSSPQRVPEVQSSAKTGIQSSSMVTSSGKNDRAASVVNNQTIKPQIAKESNPVTHTNKKKGKNEISSGGGGSLASLWGRTSAKSKTSGPATDTISDIPITAATAVAQICAHEAADIVISDDEADLNCKRELNGASNRKRRVVMDFSDEDEEEENMLRLGLPDPSSVQPGSESLHDAGKPLEKKNFEKNNSSFDDRKANKLEVKQDESEERNSGLSEGDKIIKSKNGITGISLHKKAQTDIPKSPDVGDKKANDKTTIAATSPKRRKVLKTRIDERGREVTEVVWDGEGADGNTDKNTTFSDVKSRCADSNTDKNTAFSDVTSRPLVASKAQAAGSNDPMNPMNKAGNKKPAKGGGKDAKQGNILSFFQKL